MEHHEIEKRTLCSVVGQTLIFPSCFSQTYIRETPNGRPGSEQHIKRTRKIRWWEKTPSDNAFPVPLKHSGVGFLRHSVRYVVLRSRP